MKSAVVDTHESAAEIFFRPLFELGDEIFESALHVMNHIGSWILLFGVGVALMNFGLLVVQHFTGAQFRIIFALTQPRAQLLTMEHIKLELGRTVSFSLLLLVSADVLETLLKPMHDLSMEDLYKMAMVTAIRTTLAFFLGKELEEVQHHIAHHHENDHTSTDVAIRRASSSDLSKTGSAHTKSKKASQKKKNK